MKLTFNIKTELSAGGVDLAMEVDPEGASMEDLAAFFFLLTTGSLDQNILMEMSKATTTKELGTLAEYWERLIENKEHAMEALPFIAANQTKLGL